MNDDTFSQAELTAAELAGAALDGDAEAATQADAALVTSFAALRDSLADVPPPTDEVRTRAIAAALAVFDAGDTGGDEPATPEQPAPTTWAPVTPLDAHRLRRMRRVTAAAAAVMVLGGVGAFAATRSGGGSDSAGAPTAASAPKLDESSRSGESLIESADTMAGAAETAMDADTLPAEAPPASTMVASDSAAPGTTAAADGGINGPADVSLSTGEQLFSYASTNGVNPEDLLASCPSEAALARESTVVGDQVTFNGVPAYVVTSPTGEILAVDASTCEVLLAVPGP
jgi:hypothetical protein